ncbi:MAG: phosphoribosylformylglycinamidine synthase subunit PurS [Deltaproteobacteria bacterium]|nr:phosphoribosylformylglycinamidine synthase subunit PurS [Deltaproteobacteria bacterium]
MIWRIEVALKNEIRDARGDRVQRELAHHFGIAVERVRTIDVYTVEADLDRDQIERIASEPLSDPVIQVFGVNRPLASDFDVLVEVGFRPGVTDNVGRTAREAIEDLTGRRLAPGEGVYTAVQYLFKGKLSPEQARRIATGYLANELIQSCRVIPRAEYDAIQGAPVLVPKVTSSVEPRITLVDLEVDDAGLLEISRRNMLALSLEEMRAIRGYGRRPEVRGARRQVGLGEQLTDAELEALAQTWSEHCKHKIFAARIDYRDETGASRIIDSLFKSYVVATTETVRRLKGADDICLSVFKDNAGVIRFNDDWSLVFKVETHNSPSALDPYGGALTGIVGVNRDAFGTGQGADLLFNTDVFCFASPFHQQELPARLLHPRRIFEGVVTGVEHGGNKSGIPTVNGSLVFHPRFLGKPLVYCGTGALMPAVVNGRPGHEKKARVGDRIVMTGGRIGKDGIHGATFSSEELHEGSPVTAVQIGDPITQKRMFDFLLVARDRGLYHSITDNGAGGLSSSVGEMAEDTGGFELHLDRCPLKYSGLQPWEILISEAQERMTLAVAPEKVGEFLTLAAEMGVEATDLGEFTASGYFHCLYRGRTVTYLSMEFLHQGLPQLQLEACWQPPAVTEPAVVSPQDLTGSLLGLLGRLNICSKESVVRRYDHEVKAATVVKPLLGVDDDGPSDAAVLRPLPDSFEGVVVAHGICPRFSDLDAYAMAANAVDEALRNFVAVGGDIDHVAGLDNFCWCDPIHSDRNPDGRYKLAQLVRANEALYDCCTRYQVPLISGKDSMKNDYQIGATRISIPPTILFSVIGKIPDIRKAVTMDVKYPGDGVALLGRTRRELGGSEYYDLLGVSGGAPPRVDADYGRRLFKVLNQARDEALLASCHDLSDGGLGVALAESALAGGYGLEIDLSQGGSGERLPDDVLLFSESAGRFVVTVRAPYRNRFADLCRELDLWWLGEVTDDRRFQIRGGDGKLCVATDIDTLKEAWQAPLKEL